MTVPNDLPYMQFYVNDFDNDTCGLSSVAVGVWVRMLMAMHRKRCGELSGTLDRLSKITRCSAAELEAALTEFETDNVCDVIRDCNGVVTIICRRLKREELKRATTLERVRKYRERKAEQEQDGDCNAGVTPLTRAYSQSQSHNQKENTPKESVFPFEEFWEVYGKKVERMKCERIYARISEADRQIIRDRLPAYVASTPDVTYRKNPQTYLNGRCWNDEIIEHRSRPRPPEQWQGRTQSMEEKDINGEGFFWDDHSGR